MPGTPITFDVIAREANVSRSWIYNQPDLRAEIERLRGRQRPTTRPIPDRQRATDASLHQRLQVATERIRQLETDNHYAARSPKRSASDEQTPAATRRDNKIPEPTNRAESLRHEHRPSRKPAGHRADLGASSR